MNGIYAAVSTPIDRDRAIDALALTRHCKWVLGNGIHGVCPFGTTGEGVAFSAASRMGALDRLIAGGLHASSIIPATGACAISDAIELSRHAVSTGCSTVLILPPFFYPAPPDDGIHRFYADLIERVGDKRLRILLYNIPQVTGVAITIPVVERLRVDFPGIIIGIKDSAGNLNNTLSYIAAFPDLSVFTGTDGHIVSVMYAGGAGAVTGMGNVNPKALRTVIDLFDKTDGADLCKQASAIHMVIENHGGVPAMKAAIAHYRNDANWRSVVPPLVELSDHQAKALIDELKEAGHEWPSPQIAAQ